MTTAASTVAKKCVACGTNVTHTKRMKDSQGRYWCVNCGVADQRKKIKAASKTKSVSNSGDISLMDRARSLTGGGGGGTDKGRLVKMLLVMAIIAAIAGWQFLSH